MALSAQPAMTGPNVADDFIGIVNGKDVLIEGKLLLPEESVRIQGLVECATESMNDARNFMKTATTQMMIATNPMKLARMTMVTSLDRIWRGYCYHPSMALENDAELDYATIQDVVTDAKKYPNYMIERWLKISEAIITDRLNEDVLAWTNIQPSTPYVCHVLWNIQHRKWPGQEQDLYFGINSGVPRQKAPEGRSVALEADEAEENQGVTAEEYERFKSDPKALIMHP